MNHVALPRPHVTDPLSKFTRRVHVYAKARLPKPEIAVGEMYPVVEFLQSLHGTGCLAFESVSTAIRECEDVFKRYKPVEGTQGKFGYVGSPSRTARAIRPNKVQPPHL